MLRLKLCEIDNGRYEDIIHVLDIKEFCAECYYFNKSILDPLAAFRCRIAPKCIAATLHPALIMYLNIRLGWVNG
jgi:hypothetical protein